MFSEVAEIFIRTTGRKPHGDWYLVYLAGGDLGGTQGTMWANLSNLGEKPEEHFRFMLPHELNHQVYNTAHPSVPITLVRSIVEEGFCCFLNRICWEGRGSSPKHISFSEEAWKWALAHEREVVSAAVPDLGSCDWETISKFHQWHVYPWDGAVDRLAYFLGFRLCEAYTNRHGKDSWLDFYKYPPEQIWERSGYASLGAR